MKVGIIGNGAIGSYLSKLIMKDSALKLSFVFDLDESKLKKIPSKARVLNEKKFKKMLSKTDVVVECASVKAFKLFGVEVLKKCNLIPLSLTAMASKSFEKKIGETEKKYKHNLIIPIGAIVALDGIQAIKKELKNVELVTVKKPKSFGSDVKKRTILFNGTARNACKLFPKNINIASALSLSGIGFDKTKVLIIADPAVKKTTHSIFAKAKSTELNIVVSNTLSKNVATSSLTAITTFDLLKKLERWN